MKIVKGFQLLTIFAKSSVLDVQLGSGYVSGVKINKITKVFHGSNIALAIERNGTFFYFLSVDFLLRFFCRR